MTPDTPTAVEGPARRILGVAAAVAGLGYLWLVAGGSILMQYRQVPGPPLEWLQRGALAAIPVIVLAFAARRIGWRTLAVGVPLTVWMGSGALSARALTGAWDTRSLLLGLMCAGLFFGVAASRPAWTGWTILALGAAYIYLQLVVYYRGYYSLGQLFPGTTQWWRIDQWAADSMTSVKQWRGAYLFEALPYPTDRWERIVALVRDVPQLRYYSFRGLATNPNHTGNYIAPALPFVVPFVFSRWRRFWAAHPILVAMARAGLSAAILVPGLFVLYVLEARSGLIAAAVSVLVTVVPLRWTRNAAGATAATALVLAGLFVPLVLARDSGWSFNGRDCTWSDLRRALEPSRLWGIGPPGEFPGSCRGVSYIWPHAHHEVLQAWSLGGIVGLLACLVALAGLAWFAVRYSDRDHRALLAMVVFATLVMGVEVLATFLVSTWVFLGIAWVIAVAGRSLSMMGTPRREKPDGSAMRPSTVGYIGPD